MKYEVGDMIQLEDRMDIEDKEGECYANLLATIVFIKTNDITEHTIYVLGDFYTSEYAPIDTGIDYIAVTEDQIYEYRNEGEVAIINSFNIDTLIDFTPVNNHVKGEEFKLNEMLGEPVWDLHKDTEMPKQERSKEVKPWWFT